MSYAGEPSEVANRILRETLTVNDTNIDFGPSIRRVEYDIDEIQSSMRECVAQDTGLFVQVVQDVERCGKSTQLLANDLDNIEGELGRLRTEFVAPFERLQRVHTAAQRLQTASKLVRSLNLYLGMAKQLEQSKEVLESATYVSKLQKLLVANPHLKSLEIVRTHSSRLAGITASLVSKATEAITTYKGGPSLRPAALTLCLFDSEKLLGLVDGWLKSQTAASVLAISRSFGSQQAFSAAWSLCLERATAVDQFNQVLSECWLSARAENAAGGPLVKTFWALVAKNLRAKLHTMSVANPAQMRAMRDQKEHILATAGQLNAVFIDYLNR